MGNWNKGLKAATIIFMLLPNCLLHAEPIVDDVGRTVNVNVPVKSIVCLSPGHTEILYELGQQGKIKAISQQCDYPDETKTIEKAGSFIKPDIEKIIKINPDVVISGGGIQKQTIYKLEKLKIPVLVLYPRDIKGIAGDTITIGRLTGTQDKAKGFAKKILDLIPPAGKTASITVYVELWGSPAMSAGGQSYIDDIIEAAGGQNIFKSSLSDYPKVSKEEIIKRNPDIILLLYDSEKDYVKRKWFQPVNAGKNGNIFVFSGKESDVFLRPGPRVEQGIQKIKELINKAKGCKNEK